MTNYEIEWVNSVFDYLDALHELLGTTTTTFILDLVQNLPADERMDKLDELIETLQKEHEITERKKETNKKKFEKKLQKLLEDYEK